MTKISRLTGYHHNTVRSVVKNETGCYTEVNPKFPKKDDEVVYTAKAHRKTEEELKKERKTDWKWVVTTIIAIAAVITALFR